MCVMQMSQESDASTCSQILSQETCEFLYQDVKQQTCDNFTQLVEREPATNTAELQLAIENRDFTLLNDKFQVKRTDVSRVDTVVGNADVSNAGLFIHPNVLQTINMNTPHKSLPSLPSNTPYVGEYEFEVSLPVQSKETKAVDWTFSEALRKVFVRFTQPCPFRFRTSRCPPVGTVLRVMPIYLRPQHAHEVVRRCPHHIAKAATENLGSSSTAPGNHLIRCENKLAVYEEDSFTGFHSVCVPYEHPSEQEWTTYLYQFMCFSSCVGGLNRRPVQIIFTLEASDGLIIGREAIEVRICACPGRDRQVEEKNLPGLPCANIEPGERVPVATEVLTAGPPAKRPRTEEDEFFTLSVRGRENFEILHRLRDTLEVAATIPPSQYEKLRRQNDDMRKKQVSVSMPNAQNMSVGLAEPNFEFNDASASSSNFICNDTRYLIVQKKEPLELDSNGDVLIESWLGSHCLLEHYDVFRHHGLHTVSQLHCLSLRELEKFGFNDDHLAAIWLALSRFRDTQAINISDTPPTPGGLSSSYAEKPDNCSDSNEAYEHSRQRLKRSVVLSADKRKNSSVNESDLVRKP